MKEETAIIQSAFLFKNGTHFLVTTSIGQIRSFICDENWKPKGEKPYAECPLSWNEAKSATEYHLKVRASHPPEDFVPEHSTSLEEIPTVQAAPAIQAVSDFDFAVELNKAVTAYTDADVSASYTDFTNGAEWAKQHLSSSVEKEQALSEASYRKFEKVVSDKLEHLHWEVFPKVSKELQRDIRLCVVDIENAALNAIQEYARHFTAQEQTGEEADIRKTYSSSKELTWEAWKQVYKINTSYDGVNDCDNPQYDWSMIRQEFEGWWEYFAATRQASTTGEERSKS